MQRTEATVATVMAWIRVKKGVGWALRHLGHRNAALYVAALETATKLSNSDDATDRWVGKDALRDITRTSVIAKINQKKR